MDEYKKHLKQDQTGWLLEKDNPPVRYFTLKELLDRGDGDTQVVAAQKQIMKTKAVRMLLEGQHEDGHWGEPGYRIHLPHTSGRLWLLARLGADRRHPQIQKAVDYLLDAWMQEVYHDTSRQPIREKMGYPADWGFDACMNGSCLFAFLRLGDVGDPRTRNMIDWIATHVRFDDGDRILPESLRNSKLCQGKHTCIWGTIAVFESLVEIPEKARDAKVRKVIDRAADFVLKHHINRRSHDLSRFLNPRLNQLGVSSDFVTILTTLTKLNRYDERMQDAVRYLIRKQTRDGKWKMQQTTDHLESIFGVRGRPSKWATLRAMVALKAVYSSKREP